MKVQSGRVIFLLVFLVYVLSNGLMVLSPGVWWDDWTIYNPDIEGFGISL